MRSADPAICHIFLHRTPRTSLRVNAIKYGLETTSPTKRFAGVGIPWFHVRCQSVSFSLNGVLAIAQGSRAAELYDPDSEPWQHIVRRFPYLRDYRTLRPLCLTVAEHQQTEKLEYYSAAVESLERLMDFALSRPRAAAREIAACERWLKGRFSQYLTGRGALRNVVLPWRVWLQNYESMLRSLETELDGLQPDATGSLKRMLQPLRHLTTSRDRNSIVIEYRTRLGALSEACTRVAAEIGVIGTFSSLALVPFEEKLGLFFLAPVITAGLAYYSGHDLARWVHLRSQSRPRRHGSWSTIAPSRGAMELPRIGEILTRIRCEPVQILVSPRLSAADVACALHLRHLLMEYSTCPYPLEAIRVTDTAPHAGLKIIMGGPLVRQKSDDQPAAACDLSDSAGRGWEICAGERVVVHCDDDETVGCCAVGSDGDTLFIFGVRDAGTVMALRWLAHALESPDCLGNASWVAVRRPDGTSTYDYVAHG